MISFYHQLIEQEFSIVIFYTNECMHLQLPILPNCEIMHHACRLVKAVDLENSYAQPPVSRRLQTTSPARRTRTRILLCCYLVKYVL